MKFLEVCYSSDGKQIPGEDIQCSSGKEMEEKICGSSGEVARGRLHPTLPSVSCVWTEVCNDVLAVWSCCAHPATVVEAPEDSKHEPRALPSLSL